MTISRPLHPRMPLQTFAMTASSGSTMHSCMVLTLRPCHARFSRPRWHTGQEAIV
jgi:hypothetical protein